MKKINFLLLLSAILFTSILSAQDEIVMHIPANDKIELAYPEMGSFAAHIQNKSFRDLDVKVIDINSNDQMSGFGLGMKGKAEVIVAENGKLSIANNAGSKAKVKIKIKEKGFQVQSTNDEYVSFTLRNNSAKSIPLIIPNVMNPNLSPYSNSGVDLKIGQEIYFKKNGKKEVLLIVDESIKNGDVIKVNELIKSWKNKKATPVKKAKVESVNITLRNKSAKDIPLIIPTVMNPNLSPFSTSGVNLKMGQEILFKYKGKKYVLLTVDEKIKDGDVLIMNELLNAKKKEIDLK